MRGCEAHVRALSIRHSFRYLNSNFFFLFGKMSESNWNENDNGIAGLGDPDLNDSPPAGTVATSQADDGSSAAADTLASGVQQTVLGNDASPPPRTGRANPKWWGWKQALWRKR